MEPEKKIIDAYNELQEKYSSIQICDMLDKKIKNDVSEKTVVRVLSYYLVGPTANSPPIPDPLERKSNEIASDVERAMRCAPPDLRFDHKIFYEERRKGQENDRPELLRIDEFSADKSCASGDFRLTMLLTCLESSDLLIFHKFLACTEIKTKSLKTPKKDDAQISALREDEIFNSLVDPDSELEDDVEENSEPTEAELAEIAGDLLFLRLPWASVREKTSQIVHDNQQLEVVMTKAELWSCWSQYKDAKKIRERLEKIPWLHFDYQRDVDFVKRWSKNAERPEDQLAGKIERVLQWRDLDFDEVYQTVTTIVGDKVRANKIMADGYCQYAKSITKGKVTSLPDKFAEMEIKPESERTVRLTDEQLAEFAAKQFLSGIGPYQIVYSLAAITGDRERAIRVVQTKLPVHQFDPRKLTPKRDMKEKTPMSPEEMEATLDIFLADGDELFGSEAEEQIFILDEEENSEPAGDDVPKEETPISLEEIDEELDRARLENEIIEAVFFDAKYNYYEERQLVEIVAQMIYVGLSRRAVYQQVKENVGYKNVADETFKKGCERCEETQEKRRRMLAEGEITEDDEEEYRDRLIQWLLDLKYGYWDDFDDFDDDLYVDE